MVLFQLRNLFLHPRKKKKILQPPLRSEHQPVEGAGIVAAFPTCLSRPLLLLQLLSKVDKYNKAPNTVLWVGSILTNVYKLKGICFCQLFVFLCSQLFCVYSGAGLVLHTWNSDCERFASSHCKPKRGLDDIFIAAGFKIESISYQ